MLQEENEGEDDIVHDCKCIQHQTVNIPNGVQLTLSYILVN